MSSIPVFYQMERHIQPLSKDSFHQSFNMGPRQFFQPPFVRSFSNIPPELENMLRPMENLSEVMNRMAFNDIDTIISSDDEKFQVNVDVQHFAPDEINVKVVEGNILVEAKHGEKQDEHGYIARRFIRRYELPKGCLPDTVQSSLSSDGVLTVTAPKVLAMPSIGERIVPIIPTGPIKKRLGSFGLKRAASKKC